MQAYNRLGSSFEAAWIVGSVGEPDTEAALRVQQSEGDKAVFLIGENHRADSSACLIISCVRLLIWSNGELATWVSLPGICNSWGAGRHGLPAAWWPRTQSPITYLMR